MRFETNHLQLIRQQREQGPADQDRGIRELAGEALQTAGHDHAHTDHGELQPLAGAEVAGHHLAEVQADALAQGRTARRGQFGIELRQAGLHRQGRPDRRQGFHPIAAAAGHAELGHQRIADELVEQALLGDHGGGDGLEIAVEQAEQLGGRQHGAEGGEGHQVGEEHHATAPHAPTWVQIGPGSRRMSRSSVGETRRASTWCR